MQQAEYTQLKSHAKIYGGIMGIWFSLSFVCFVGVMYEPAMSLAFDCSILAIPFIAAHIVKQYRERVAHGIISFKHAFLYTLMVLFHAILILAIVQWIYFEFIDTGRIISTMLERINAPEMEAVFTSGQLSKKDLTEQLDMISKSRPIDLVFSFMWFNIISSFFISFAVALICKRTKKQIY